MVASRSISSRSRLVPAEFLRGASCLLPCRDRELPGKLTPAERLVAAHVARGLSDQPSPGATAGRQGDILGRLTNAETKVALLVSQGLSNKEISSALGRAEATVKHQLSSTMRKLGVQSRCQLIVRLLT